MKRASSAFRMCRAAGCFALLTWSLVLCKAQAQPFPQRQFTVGQLVKDAKDFCKLFYYHVLGPRLLQLRYKVTLNTYRIANLIFNLKTLWRASAKPLYRTHAGLTRQLYPHIRQITGSNLSRSDAQLLAQSLALVLPLLALLLGLRMLKAAWQRRPWRQTR